MFGQVKQTAQELEQIVLYNATDKVTVKNQLKRLKTLMPEQAIAYIPSGKTNLVSIIIMGLGLIPVAIFNLAFNFVVLFLLMLAGHVISLILTPLNIDKFFVLLFLLLFVTMRRLYPYHIITNRVGKFIAYLGKISYNRHPLVPAVMAGLPSSLLLILSINQFFKMFDRLYGEPSTDLSIRAILIFIAVVSGQTTWKIFNFVKEEVYKQKFAEDKLKFYHHYESRKYAAHLAPYLKYLVVNQAYLEPELKEIISRAFEGYKSFVVVNVYKFPSNES